MGEPAEDEHWLSTVRHSSPYAGLGWQIAGAMVIFAGGGAALDVWLGTMPWITVAGALVGVASIFALLYRVNAEMNAASRRRKSGVKPPADTGRAAP